MEPILLIDKPKGITSFDVIRRLRREFGVRKMGHAGTLDPLASGLMIVGVGEGTKLLTEYLKLPKEYVADVLLGERRTTGDMEGAMIEECPVEHIDRDLVVKTLGEMCGTLELPVPHYSAIKRDGVPLYKTARRRAARGEELPDDERPIRPMLVREAELLDMVEEGTRVVLTIRFAVGSGTYIRSLGEELGRRLGLPATLRDLRRTTIGDFSVRDARSCPEKYESDRI